MEVVFGGLWVQWLNCKSGTTGGRVWRALGTIVEL